ncbi:MAG TPA: adenylyltransferase/cytidyltransferase family protein [Actinomycetota bacterium]|nr:adenylyltransferase/cytidyltransferase family protein [Actinomycetota bacterium]
MQRDRADRRDPAGAPDPAGIASVLEELRSAERPTLLVLGEPPPRPRTVALLSGSFDPPTVGHLALAEAVRAEADLVLLVYSARTLPKEPGTPPPLLAEEARVEAIRALAEGRPWLRAALCSHGLLADQARAAAERFPGARLLLAMGSDKALQVLDPRWYEDRDRTLAELFALAEVRYAVRVGDEGRVEAALAEPGNAPWRGRFGRLQLPPGVALVSSRAVREALREGRPVGGWVPPEVLRAIERAGGRV